MKEKISVIVPVYKEEDYVGECIESIVGQTYKNLEIILVDDGSPDKCPQICDEWAKRDNRIIVIHKKNGGLVSARQAGLKAATGDYIAYVDGDDWIESSMYEDMLKTMNSENVDVVITGFKKELFGKSIVYLNNISEGVYTKKELRQDIFPKMMWDLCNCQCGLFTYMWNKLFRKEKIYPYQMGIDERIVIGEDAACVYPVILNSDSIVVTGHSGYHYRQRMDSLLRTTSNGSENIFRLQIFYNYMQTLYKKENMHDVMQEQLYHFYFNHLIMMSDNLTTIYPDLGENFPFFHVTEGSRVIIYSAGAYGIHVYKQFSRCPKFEVVSWTDPDFAQYEKSDYKVVSLDDALRRSYDFIIIASVDRVYIEETEEILGKHNVDVEKIVSIKSNYVIAIDRLEKKNMFCGE